jgi:HEAT repeat protein
MDGHDTPAANPDPTSDDRSDWKVVLQFFIVPLSLVVVLVSLFFGLQLLRSRRPDPGETLASLEHYDGFLGAVVGDLKRWQSGYDLSILLRTQNPEDLSRMLPGLTAAFREAGDRKDLKVRRYLALALGYVSGPQATEALREALRDDDAETRLNAVWGLARSGEGSVRPDLRAALGDADPGVRKLAAFALGAMLDRDAAPDLRAALQDPVQDVTWNAALALARLGDASALPPLLRMLERGLGSEEGAGSAAAPDLAVNAIRGLVVLRSQEARPALERAAASSDEAIRGAARLALEALAEAKPVAEAASTDIR